MGGEGGEKKIQRERERLPVLNYSRMRTSQKQSCWIFRMYRKLLLVDITCEINLKISIKCGFNDWFWLLSLRQPWLYSLGLVTLFLWAVW